MTTINLTLYQPRVDNPFGCEQTEFAIIADVDDNISITSESEARFCIRECNGFYRRVAKVIVTHPAVMAGDWQEIRRDMESEIAEALKENGLCAETISGNLFLI